MVVTIVVLLILAGISISLVLGDNGLIRKARDVKEQTEIAKIKEEAEMVKGNLSVTDLIGNNEISETIQRNNLIEALNEHFEGSQASGSVITTADRKYDIIVKENSEILVVKHGENYVKSGEIGFVYYTDVSDERTTIHLSPIIGGLDTYEQYARKKLEGKKPEEKETMFVQGYKALYGSEMTEEVKNIDNFADFVKALIEDDNAPTTLEELRIYFENNGQKYDTVDDLLIDNNLVEPEEYYGKSYESYAKEIINEITETGDARDKILEQYFIESYNYNNFGEQKYTTWEELMNYFKEEGQTTYDSLKDAVSKEASGKTVEEFLIENEMIKTKEYKEYKENLDNSRMVTIELPDGNTEKVTNKDYITYDVNKDGIYTFRATGPNGEKGKIDIKVDNILPYINSILVNRNGNKIEVTVNATNAAKYQFKIDDGQYSKAQTSNVYNFNIGNNLPGKEATENNPYIPEGYKYLEGTIDTGYVITDDIGKHVITIKAINETGKKNTEKNKEAYGGNEWVWIPVDSTTLEKMVETPTEAKTLCGTTGDTAVTTNKYSKTITIGKDSNTATLSRTTPGTTSDYREPDIVVGDNGTGYDAKDTNYKTILGETGTKEQLAKLFVAEYNEMITSIEKYGGFYIGRYELSEEGVQKDKPTLVYTNWYNLYNACRSSKLQASDKVKTGMIWGCQWDVTCNFIANKGDKKSITDSRTWGNYNNSDGDAKVIVTENGTETKKYGSKQNTGYSEYWKANNIYDLAGNCDEWTQEAFYTGYRAGRGGSCGSNGSISPASIRISGGYPGNGNSSYGRFSSHFNNKVALNARA